MGVTIVRCYEGMDIDELDCEIQDLYNAIEDEKALCNLASTDEDLIAHMNNMQTLRAEIAYIRSLQKELQQRWQ